MLFPYIRCGTCGWTARKEMRAKARSFAERYIEAHPKKTEETRDRTGRGGQAVEEEMISDELMLDLHHLG